MLKLDKGAIDGILYINEVSTQGLTNMATIKKGTKNSKIGETMATRQTRPNHNLPEPFLPDSLTIVKIIAAYGVNDEDMELMLNLGVGRMAQWRKLYPSFEKAIEEGRTMADVEVMLALHKKATGYEQVDSTIFGKGEEARIVDIVRQIPPDTKAIEVWLKARKPDTFNRPSEHRVGPNKDDNVLGVNVEEKEHVVSSILALIPCADDPEDS